MKIQPDLQSGTVLIRLTAREATRIAKDLFAAAITSGAPAEEIQAAPTEQSSEEQAQG